MMFGSPAWKPQAILALVITSSSALSSPSFQTPNPSPRSLLRSTTSVVRGSVDTVLMAEATLSLPVRAQGANEVHLPEIGPEGFAKIELAMGRLPHQEAGQALLAGRPDDQVRVR